MYRQAGLADSTWPGESNQSGVFLQPYNGCGFTLPADEGRNGARDAPDYTLPFACWFLIVNLHSYGWLLGRRLYIYPRSGGLYLLIESLSICIRVYIQLSAYEYSIVTIYLYCRR